MRRSPTRRSGPSSSSRVLFACGLAAMTPLWAPEGVEAQTCPSPAAESLEPRIEVHVFQTSCDAPLVPGKRAVVRVWAMWFQHPGNPSAPATFDARVTITDGAGQQIAAGDFVFRRPPWSSRDLPAAKHTFQAAFVPRPGSIRSPLTVTVQPRAQDQLKLFPDPGTRPFRFMDANPEREDGHWNLDITYIAPLVGAWAGGEATEARAWMKTTASDAETFVIQNLPVNGVRRHGLLEVPIDVPDATQAPCPSSPGAICTYYETWGFDEKAEDYLARQFDDHADESIAVLLLPAGYAGDSFRGKTVLFGASMRAQAALSSAGVDLPNNPVVVLPADAEAWVLAHELVHAFREDATHTDGGSGLAPGIRGFRVPLKGPGVGFNKHSTEGNGEARVLQRLMDAGTNPAGLTERWITDATYAQMVAAVPDSDDDLWALGPGAKSSRPEDVRGTRTDRAESPGALASGPAAPPFSIFDRPPPTRVQAREPRVVVAGAFGPDGQIGLDPLRVAWRRDDAGTPVPGPYRAELRDGNDRSLGSVSFDRTPSVVHDPEARLDPGSTFVVDLPPAPGAVRAVVVDGSGTVLDSRAVGGALPALGLDVRAASDSILSVGWTATGGDAPFDLRLEYAPDGDGDWAPLTTSLTSSPVRLGRVALQRGARPTLRLLASNGIAWTAEEAVLDLDDIQIVRRLPSPGATDGDGFVGVSFNSALDPGVVGSAALLLRSDDGTDVSGALTYDEGTATLWFEAESPLPSGRAWTAVVSPSLRDRWGNRIAGERSWTFRSPDDVEPPRVVTALPADGDLTLPLTTRPVVVFDEPLAGDLTRGLRLETVAGVAVAGETRWVPEPRALLFLPSAPLEMRTTYRLFVSPSVADQAGNPIGDVPPIVFTTAGTIQVGGGR